MNGELIVGLLVGLLLIGLLNLCGLAVLWWRLIGLVARVTKLEAYQTLNLTHAETRAIYERLASIEGQVQTTNRLMQTVQQHLLESER